MKASWEIDVPVLLIFFVRAEPFRQVFEAVRQAKPSTVLLWQDGPRPGRSDDIKALNQCREIAESIDWECKIYRNYQDKNIGCDPSTFLAHKWAFSLVEKCIVLEDDRVPDPSFFIYCKQLLDQYQNDKRISHICGTNLLGVYNECGSDYFFASHGSTTWASWRRTANQWDEAYSYLDDPYVLDCLKGNLKRAKFKQLYGTAQRHRSTKTLYWETILGMSSILHNQLVIIPKRNLVCDIGMTLDSTHAPADARCVPKIQRTMFHMKTYPMTFPIKHPAYFLVDPVYEAKIDAISGDGHPLLQMWRTLQRVFLYLRFREKNRLLAGLKHRFN